VLVRQTADNGVVFYSSPQLRAVGVNHGFSTRIGGVSPPPFQSLNLGNLAGDIRDEAANVTENLQRFQVATGLADRRRSWVHQAHGNRVAIVCNSAFENGIQADAMITADSTAALLVRVADCVPILLATDDGKAVAAIHAGWRGVVGQVVPEAVNALIALAEVSPNRIIAAIGPCISLASFEVGPEVIAEFVRLFGESPRWMDGYVDLPAAVFTQLRACGIASERIDTTDRCTARDQDEFFSHRRDRGITGRMAAVIGAANR
jgi:YfiH family protein